MSAVARHLSLRGSGEYRDEAEALLAAPGDAATVRRGRLRSLLIKCPDGCGETLVVNLDARAGKAWRLYERADGISLFPSVWRADGCESHFIVWSDHILWCGIWDEDNVEPAYMAELEARALAELESDEPTSYRSSVAIADALAEIPWAVARALRRLVGLGRAEEGRDRLRDHFRRCRGEGAGTGFSDERTDEKECDDG
jgi:hypothetical protein